MRNYCRIYYWKLRVLLRQWKYGPQVETMWSPPITKLAHRIIEDSYLQGAAAFTISVSNGVPPATVTGRCLSEDGEWVRVHYRIRGEDAEQMALPHTTFANLFERYQEMTDASGQIVFERFNPEFKLNLRLEQNDAHKFTVTILRP
jgi:hypothetical protein